MYRQIAGALGGIVIDQNIAENDQRGVGDLDNVVVVHRRAAVNALSVDSDPVLAVVVKHDPAGRGAPQNGVLTRGCKVGQPHHGVLSAADGDIDQPAHVKEPPRFIVAQSGAKDHNDALGVRTVEGLAVNAENIAVGQTERARAAVVIGLQLDAVDIGSVQAVIINIVVSSLAISSITSRPWMPRRSAATRSPEAPEQAYSALSLVSPSHSPTFRFLNKHSYIIVHCAKSYVKPFGRFYLCRISTKRTGFAQRCKAGINLIDYRECG